MTKRKEDRRYCLITGASRGLGNALAKCFWADGWSLVLVGRSRDGLTNVVNDLGSRSDQTIDLILQDFAQPNASSEVVVEARRMVPRLNALINNAAIQGAIGPLWENSWQEWEETIQVDLFAPVRLCRAVAPWMIETGTGSIINLSGGGATAPRVNFSAYATAKAGLVRFSETIAEELKPHHIRVNCVAPGVMGTAMLEAVIAKGEQAVGEHEYSVARKALTEDGGASMQKATELCLFLASERSIGITGKLISAVWDSWEKWPAHLDQLAPSDVYTLRRIAGRDRGFAWGDK